MNVGNRYIEFPSHIPYGPALELAATQIVRAIEEEMRQAILASEDHTLTSCYHDIDLRVNEIKEIIKDVLKDYGHDVDMEELDEIFRQKISSMLPF